MFKSKSFSVDVKKLSRSEQQHVNTGETYWNTQVIIQVWRGIIQTPSPLSKGEQIFVEVLSVVLLQKKISPYDTAQRQHNSHNLLDRNSRKFSRVFSLCLLHNFTYAGPIWIVFPCWQKHWAASLLASIIGPTLECGLSNTISLTQSGLLRTCKWMYLCLDIRLVRKYV